jgi:hypothetical protein
MGSAVKGARERDGKVEEIAEEILRPNPSEDKHLKAIVREGCAPHSQQEAGRG